MDEVGEWKLSPGYDLTFSGGPDGKQSTIVMGEGRNITIQHLIKLGSEARLPKELINNIIEKTRALLDGWSGSAKEYGVGKDNTILINRMIKRL